MSRVAVVDNANAVFGRYLVWCRSWQSWPRFSLVFLGHSSWISAMYLVLGHSSILPTSSLFILLTNHYCPKGLSCWTLNLQQIWSVSCCQHWYLFLDLCSEWVPILYILNTDMSLSTNMLTNYKLSTSFKFRKILYNIIVSYETKKITYFTD